MAQKTTKWSNNKNLNSLTLKVYFCLEQFPMYLNNNYIINRRTKHLSHKDNALFIVPHELDPGIDLNEINISNEFYILFSKWFENSQELKNEKLDVVFIAFIDGSIKTQAIKYYEIQRMFYVRAKWKIQNIVEKEPSQ